MTRDWHWMTAGAGRQSQSTKKEDAYRWGLILANSWIQTACWCWNDDPRATQPGGLAGSPSLFANVVNSPVPADTNALNTPAVDDVVKGNAGVAPGVMPNNNLTITSVLKSSCNFSLGLATELNRS